MLAEVRSFRQATWRESSDCRAAFTAAVTLIVMFIKVCGVRTEADITTAAMAGADAVGLVFGESVRHVDVDLARRLVKGVPPQVLAVGVFGGVAVREVARLAEQTGVGAVQLHGPYPRSAFEQLGGSSVRLLRATTLDTDTDLRVGAYGEEMLLLDSAVAGSGHRWDLLLLDRARPQGRWLLAGGLSPDNVAEAVAVARPWGVDVSSGVESRRGVKDHGLIREFVAAARDAGGPQSLTGPVAVPVRDTPAVTPRADLLLARQRQALR